MNDEQLVIPENLSANSKLFVAHISEIGDGFLISAITFNRLQRFKYPQLRLKAMHL